MNTQRKNECNSKDNDDGYLGKNIPWYLVPIALVLLSISALFKAVGDGKYPDNIEISNILTHISVEAGIAVIIAFCISVGIEKRAREHHNRMVEKQIAAIKDNYYEATFNHSFDPQFLNVAKSIFSQSLFRKGYELTIVLSFVNDSNASPYCLLPDSVIQVDIVSTFKMHNLSNEDVEYEWKFFIEKSDIEEHKSSLISLKINKISLSKDELIIIDEDAPDSKLFNYYLKKETIPANSEIFFEITTRNYKYARDNMFWRTLTPSDGLRLTVTYPNQLYMAGDTVGIVSQANNGWTTHGNGPKTSVLIINEPLMPHNGAYIWWYPLR